METYFKIKRGKLATAIFLIIGLVFTWYGATFSLVLFRCSAKTTLIIS